MLKTSWVRYAKTGNIGVSYDLIITHHKREEETNTTITSGASMYLEAQTLRHTFRVSMADPPTRPRLGPPRLTRYRPVIPRLLCSHGRLDGLLRLPRLLLLLPSEPKPSPSLSLRRLLPRHGDDLPIRHPRSRFVLALQSGLSLCDPGTDAGGTARTRDGTLGSQVFLTPDG